MEQEAGVVSTTLPHGVGFLQLMPYFIISYYYPLTCNHPKRNQILLATNFFFFFFKSKMVFVQKLKRGCPFGTDSSLSLAVVCRPPSCGSRRDESLFVLPFWWIYSHNWPLTLAPPFFFLLIRSSPWQSLAPISTHSITFL